MLHTNKNGSPKILRKCNLPITAKSVVNIIITEKAVFHVTAQGLFLKEKDPDFTVEDIRAITEAEFIAAPDICEYRLK